jgi:hypothetical protein
LPNPSTLKASLRGCERLPSSITSPEGGSTVYGSQTVQVQWETDSGARFAAVDVYVTDDWQQVAFATTETGSADWTVPDDVDRDDAVARVRFTDYDGWPDSDVVHTATSDAFSIRPAVLTITDPTESTIWVSGREETIEWVATGPVELRVFVKEGAEGTWGCVADMIDASAGAYAGNMSSFFRGDDCYVKLAERGDENPEAIFGPFEVAMIYTVTLMPDGSTALVIGATHDIYANGWGSSFATIDMEFWRDGVKVETLAQNVTPGTIVPGWPVPGPASDNCFIRNVSTSDPTIFADSPFKIVEP